ncbi:MAG: hypothetical protein LBT05_00420 [Planctomycetaceae bacterium]|jgi:hypothetical protein|nr:hypothetical protein [Planctomycetaceae bacterium]
MDNRNHFHHLIFQGAKEAIELEIQKLRKEKSPIPVWENGRVVDISFKLRMQATSRIYFLIGIAFMIVLSVLEGVMVYITEKNAIAFLLNSIALICGIMSSGMFGLGAWYGDQATRRNCILLLVLLIPATAYLIYLWFTNGF